MRLYFRGYVASVPWWLPILEAAKWNPLEAQRMIDELTPEWWRYYRAAAKERSAVVKEQERKARRDG